MARKKLSVILLERREQPELYALLDETYKEQHQERMKDTKPKIALARKLGWKADKDGRQILGQCRRVTELDRQLHGFDFVILVHEIVLDNKETFGVKLLRALIDHELCHCSVSVDEDGQVKKDETGKPVYRIRKHDLEEFREIVKRHGLYKNDLAHFARVIVENQKRPLFRDALKA
ncbi:MAG: hypothetical protein KIS92_04415 [Planctomycetota bacterium]|nr:hypothetical protein [Planctomycetota bacterium]